MYGKKFTVLIKQDGDWWLGWVEEVPGANAQERTREELTESLEEAVRDILALRRQESRKGTGRDFQEVPFGLDIQEQRLFYGGAGPRKTNLSMHRS